MTPTETENEKEHEQEQEHHADEKDMQWKRKLNARDPRFRIFVIAGVIVLVVVGFFVWRYLTSYESTDDAQIDGHLNPISARISGHVLKLQIEDNQLVHAGDTLLQIDPADYQVALQQAQADYDNAVAQAKAAEANVPITSVNTESQVSTAQADVDAARAGISVARQQLDASRAQQAEAEANNVKAQNDLGRYKQLVDKQEISEQQYDQAVASSKARAAGLEAARAAAVGAQHQVTQAQAKLEQAEADLRYSATAPQQVASIRARADAARAMAEAKKAALDKAKLDMLYTQVISPVDGIVSNRTVEVGQNVQPGQQLLTIIPLTEDDLWVTANFKENQLKDMHVGQRVTISVDALDHDYKGQVQSIAGASGARFSLLPPENATGNYVKVVQRIPVKIIFEKGQDPQHNLRPGLSVEPKVWIR
ncbi:MAG TPA: HlyD family secretion protein [Terriglobales bacterium]|jgi:membrane fusion protein (multidrug efflux system)